MKTLMIVALLVLATSQVNATPVSSGAYHVKVKRAGSSLTRRYLDQRSGVIIETSGYCTEATYRESDAFLLWNVNNFGLMFGTSMLLFIPEMPGMPIMSCGVSKVYTRPLDRRGCCSDHGGICDEEDSGYGQVVCCDGDDSPTCN